MRAYIINENPDWIGPIGRSLDAVGVEWKEWFVNEGAFELTSEPPEGLFFNRMSASSRTRGHAYSIAHTRELVAWLEGAGRRVLNGSRVIDLEMCKVRQISALRAAGLPVPRTTAVAGGIDSILAAARALPFPLIIKPNCGGKGLGVRLASSLAELEGYLCGPTFEPPADGVSLLQEYIRSADASITRCEFVGGSFVYAIRSSTSDGFELCPADACAPCVTSPAAGGNVSRGTQPRFSLRHRFRNEIVERLEHFVRAVAIDVCGIEFIENERGEKFVYDINATTNYNAAIEAEAAARGDGSAGERLAALIARECCHVVAS